MESSLEKQKREAKRRSQIVISPEFAGDIRRAWGNSDRVITLTLEYTGSHPDFRKARRSDGFEVRIEELANTAKKVDDFIEDLRDIAVNS